MRLEDGQDVGFPLTRQALHPGGSRRLRDRGMAPAVTFARSTCGLPVGRDGLRQAGGRVLRLPAAVDHPVQGREVLGPLDAGARAAEDALAIEGRKRLEPEFLGLRELRGVLEGAVVLVVVVQPEEREDLVDRIDPVRVRGLSRPSCGR